MKCSFCSWLFFKSFFRYKNLRSPAAFGSALHKLFETVENQLQRKPPSRTGFLHMMKELGTFIRHKEDVPEADQDAK